MNESRWFLLFVSVLLIGLLPALSGCVWMDEFRPRHGPAAITPELPYDLTTERIAGSVRVTWRGPTAAYDLQQSFFDARTGRWQDFTSIDELRPALTYQGRYVKVVNALPQPMRFRVRSVQDTEKSDWTRWVRSDPQ